ncbi:hypothetical protein [Agrobacterium tumefaciens]|uniref:hypothetical protein n=1 Tax=Agrobacterium tumefaciens TaxID=358 RepID=UPI001FAABC9C|nr:hypothetical protein [Agrobacterium tumefaciens]UNZ50409.1 hypothetical protein MLE07_13775 [Agrobacterium tumefaciens]
MTPFTPLITDAGLRVLDIELARQLGVDNLQRFQGHISDHADMLNCMGNLLEAPVASYDQREASKVYFLTVAHALCIAEIPLAFGYEADLEKTYSTIEALYALNADYISQRNKETAETCVATSAAETAKARLK